MTKTRATLRAVAALIEAKEPFDCNGTLTGEFWTVGNASRLGQLPDSERVILREDGKRFSRELFVVWSYDTPIYWQRPDGTHYRPEVKYSMTTSKHQGKCPRNEDCAGRGGTNDPRCGRYLGHYGPCDWTD